MTREEKIRRVVDEVEAAFGRIISTEFPEVTSGDFPPHDSFMLSQSLEHAVRTWLLWNTKEDQS